MAMDSHYFSYTSSAAVITIAYSSRFRILCMIPSRGPHWNPEACGASWPAWAGPGPATTPASHGLGGSANGQHAPGGLERARRKPCGQSKRTRGGLPDPESPSHRKETGPPGHPRASELTLTSGFRSANFAKGERGLGPHFSVLGSLSLHLAVLVSSVQLTSILA